MAPDPQQHTSPPWVLDKDRVLNSMEQFEPLRAETMALWGIWVALLDLRDSFRQAYGLAEEEEEAVVHTTVHSLVPEGEAGIVHSVKFRDEFGNVAWQNVRATGIKQIMEYMARQHLKVLEVRDGS